jgi:hypothetical protein
MTVFGAALACIVKFGLSLPMVTIIWGLLLVTLMVTPVLAFAGKPERRAFHAGFAWFGWMYVLICMFGSVTHSPNSFSSISPIRFPQMSIERGIFVVYKWVVPPVSRMFTSENPEWLYNNLAAQYDSGITTPFIKPPATSIPNLGPSAGFAPAGGGFLGGGAISGTPVPPPPVLPYRYLPWELFRDIAHALLAVLWATLGGCLALFLARRNARRPSESATPTPR